MFLVTIARAYYYHIVFKHFFVELRIFKSKTDDFA